MVEEPNLRLGQESERLINNDGPEKNNKKSIILDENFSDEGGDKFKPEVIHEYLKRISERPRKRSQWRNGAPPRNWVWGIHICEVCGRDSGYAHNLNLHRKRKHGLDTSSKPESKRKFIKPREPSSDQIIKQIARKLQQTEIQKAISCNQCSACNNADCLACRWCLDRKKYGGPGRLNRRCITRRCQTPVVTTYPVKRSYTHSGGLVKAMPCQQCDSCR